VIARAEDPPVGFGPVAQKIGSKRRLRRQDDLDDVVVAVLVNPVRIALACQ